MPWINAIAWSSLFDNGLSSLILIKSFDIAYPMLVSTLFTVSSSSAVITSLINCFLVMEVLLKLCLLM